MVHTDTLIQVETIWRWQSSGWKWLMPLFVHPGIWSPSASPGPGQICDPLQLLSCPSPSLLWLQVWFYFPTSSAALSLKKNKKKRKTWGSSVRAHLRPPHIQRGWYLWCGNRLLFFFRHTFVIATQTSQSLFSSSLLLLPYFILCFFTLSPLLKCSKCIWSSVHF